MNRVCGLTRVMRTSSRLFQPAGQAHRRAHAGVSRAEYQDVGHRGVLSGVRGLADHETDAPAEFVTSAGGLTNGHAPGTLAKSDSAAEPLMTALVVTSAIGPVERLLNMLGYQHICALAYSIAFVMNWRCSASRWCALRGQARRRNSLSAHLRDGAPFWIVRDRRGLHVSAFGKKP